MNDPSSRKPARPGAHASRRSLAVRTLPEQIADDVGAAIARGEYRQGDRLLEQDLSAQYGVSRGPVREALRILEQRSLVEIYPRRGAYVTGVNLDSLVDLFNIRAVFMGLATRYFALIASEAARDDLEAAIRQLEATSKLEDTDAIEFQKRTALVGRTITQGCGSDALRRIIEHQNHSSAYGSLFQSGRFDFTTRERRLAAAGDYTAMGEAIRAHNGERAEAIMRKMIMTSRENAIAALATTRGESFDERRLLKA